MSFTKMSEEEAQSLLQTAERENDRQSAAAVIREMEHPASNAHAGHVRLAHTPASGQGAVDEVKKLVGETIDNFEVSPFHFKPFDFRRLRLRNLTKDRRCDILVLGAFAKQPAPELGVWVVRTRDELAAAVREAKIYLDL